MKKTIASLAIMTSATIAAAMPGPRDPNAPAPKLNTICLSQYVNQDGSVSLSNCNSARNNVIKKLEIKENGCAENQASIKTYENLAIRACLPPGVVQL